jgi:DnaJ-class molecular chaperone
VQDCYEILNVTADATRGEIKRGYHQMSLKYHPDKVSDQYLNPWMQQLSNLEK